jgi:sulfur-oxidizing protein SoxA
LFAIAIFSAVAAIAEQKRGYEFQSEDVQALQDDEFSNPGMLWVDEGRDLFNQRPATAVESCRGCHEQVGGLATRYPSMNPRLNKLVSLTEQVQICRETYQHQPAIEYESRTALALTAYIAYQSQGMPLRAPQDEALESAIAKGKDYYYARKGQLNLSCAQCHEDNSGRYLRGDLISQGRSNGYPIYRLEWESLGSLHRRFRSCDIGVRAEPFELGSEAYTTLELYLRDRSATLPITAPAVRR